MRQLQLVVMVAFVAGCAHPWADQPWAVKGELVGTPFSRKVKVDNLGSRFRTSTVMCEYKRVDNGELFVKEVTLDSDVGGWDAWMCPRTEYTMK